MRVENAKRDGQNKRPGTLHQFFQNWSNKPFQNFGTFFTGICLIITPSFIIGESNFPVPSGLQGEFFCRLVSSHYFLFTLGKISVALVMCLAIDRWFAIYRPLKYQTAFKRIKVFRNIAVIVVICCAMNSRAIFEKRPVVKQKVSKHKCECISFF